MNMIINNDSDYVQLSALGFLNTTILLVLTVF